jgi:hypothetical protein
MPKVNIITLHVRNPQKTQRANSAYFMIDVTLKTITIRNTRKKLSYLTNNVQANLGIPLTGSTAIGLTIGIIKG